MDQSHAFLDVWFEVRNVSHIEGKFCLSGKTDLEEIIRESHLDKRADGKLPQNQPP